MYQYKDFTFDPVRFPLAEVKKFVDRLHENNQHYIVITDAGAESQMITYLPTFSA